METRRIAIDGPAGAGKSTLGELLARHLEFLYIDTGAMYRAVAWLALQYDLGLQDEVALLHIAHKNPVTITRPAIHDGRQYTVLSGGKDITWDIRSAVVTRSVPIVSLNPRIRSLLIAQQRALAEQESVVMVGRDIGTVVLPNAELKIYLNASAEVRAQRRYQELVVRRTEHAVLPSLAEVLHDIRSRDALDSVNMEAASDAIELQSDQLNTQEVLEQVLREYQRVTVQALLCP